MATKAEFAAFVMRLAAAIPRFAPDFSNRGNVEIWFEQLGDLDTPTLTKIYKQAIGSFDSFPSIREVLGLIGMAPMANQDIGRDIAERIWHAIGRGWASSRNSETMTRRDEFVGPIGSQVVRMAGGWERLSDIVTDDQMTFHKAQWREYASICAYRGIDAPPPDLSQLPGKAHDAVKALVDKTIIR